MLATSRYFDNLTSSVCCWDTRLQSEICLGPLKGKKASGKIRIEKSPWFSWTKTFKWESISACLKVWSGKKKSSHHYVHIWSGELCQSFHWNIPNIHWPLWLKKNAALCWKDCKTTRTNAERDKILRVSHWHFESLHLFIYLFIFAVNTKNIFVAR